MMMYSRYLKNDSFILLMKDSKDTANYIIQCLLNVDLREKLLEVFSSQNQGQMCFSLTTMMLHSALFLTYKPCKQG